MRTTTLVSAIIAATPSRAAVASVAPSGLFEVDLPLGPSLPRPNSAGTAARRPGAVSQAHLNGRNLRYSPDGNYGVLIPYLTADMVGKQPGAPIDLWAIGSYRLDVQAARIDVNQGDLNLMLRSAVAPKPGQKRQISSLKATMLNGNRVEVGGIAYPLGIPLPVPFSLRAQITAPNTQTVRLAPESVRVFGLPVGWALKLFHINLASHIPAPVGLVNNGPNGSLDVDTTKTDLFTGQITGIDIHNGGASVRIGGQPALAVDRRRRADDPNYCEVRAEGEVQLDAGNLRDGTVVVIADDPSKPYTLNKWDVEGYAKVENGQIVLPEKKLIDRFSNVGGGFTVKQVYLNGIDLVVSGSKEVLGMPIPVSFKVQFQASARGELRLWPHDVHVAGIGIGQSQIVAAMAGMPGMRKDGDGVVLDMKVASKVQMPPLVAVRAEAGKIVLDAGTKKSLWAAV